MKKKGFTLLELVIVIAIISILVAIAAPKYLQSNLKAQAVAHNANVRTVKNAAILYLTDNPDATDISITTLSDYFEGDPPKPAEGLGDEFIITVVDGNVSVKPGNVVVENKRLVEVK